MSKELLYQAHKILGSYLTARHEPLGNSAKLTSQRALCSVVYGHIHRIMAKSTKVNFC